MANVLMLQLKHPDFERFIDFSSDNLTLTVQSADELQSTIEKLITDKNFFQQQTDLMQKAISNYLANQTKTVDVMMAGVES
jgi:predicted transcriptional regulator